MSAPVFVTTNYSDFYGSGMLPVLQEIFKGELKMHESKREKLFRMRKSRNGLFQYSEIHDMPLHAQIPEGTQYSFNKPSQGADKTLQVVKFGLGASISDESIRDAKFDVVADIIRKMAKSASESREVQAMNIFNNAFTSETTADGQYICDTDHTLPSGRTFRNKLSAAADLSQSSLDSALSDCETEFVGDTGIIYSMKPKILLVHSDSRRYANELLGSDRKPDSMDNNLNSLKGEGIQVVSSAHLTDTDAWFLIADKEETGLTVVEDYGIQTKGWEDEDTDSVKYKSRFREKIGCMHPYGIFGSEGA